jgi:antitoxin ParD1/3/4
MRAVFCASFAALRRARPAAVAKLGVPLALVRVFAFMSFFPITAAPGLNYRTRSSCPLTGGRRPGSSPNLSGSRLGFAAYGSHSEVIREALRGWLERDRRLAALDGAVARGVADTEAVRVQNIEPVRTELRQRLRGKA